MKNVLLNGLWLLALSVPAMAIEPDASSQKQTEAWLQLQASGRAASNLPQPQAPAERDLSLQRWLNSYQHPIPEFYERKKEESSSGSGSAGRN
ncbi:MULTISPECIES: DUF3613 domain-containing protein [unclassified Pseudomonas]|uniref:DUF3613 domain-containing protein n=1 Tax=unclassified Pseudomonas TaxID=196821 RepID=UPI0025DDD80E|nr:MULTISPECIES: DUF3613 domain-containing protein [unclassified Pseudomonas]